MRHLIAGMAADEQHQFRLMHDLVGRRRGIVSGATDRQAMPRRDHAAAAERGGDRRGQRLGQRQQFLPGAGRSGAGAGDDDDPLCRAQRRGSALDLVVRGRRPMRRHRQLKRRIGDRRLRSPCRSRSTSACSPFRSRCAGRGVPVIASRHAWRIRRGRSAASVDIGGELRHRREQRRVRDFLIRVAMLHRAAACARSSRSPALWPRYASCKPAARFAAPTDCAKQMPGRPAMRA